LIGDAERTVTDGDLIGESADQTRTSQVHGRFSNRATAATAGKVSSGMWRI
jgi:hypothetical protein